MIDPDTVPSTLDLLRQPFVFSQSHLLTDTQFISEARKRGFSFHRGELELLHRRRALVPFYRIHSRPTIGATDRTPSQQVHGEAWELYLASAEGRLIDPARHTFTRWPRVRSKGGLYYSHHQLAFLRSLRVALDRMTGHRDGSGIVWTLDRLSQREQASHASNRALAVVLEALSPRYLPRVTRVLRSPDHALTHFVNSHDPVAEEHFLASLDDDILLRLAERLLSGAQSFDPLGSWHRVTRIANPRRWDELRNDALIAQEQRIAAEVILQFLEDRAAKGAAPSLPPASTKWREPRHDRLRIDQRERAETIMDFGLSDRPAVYLAVEGATEKVIVSKALGLADFDHLTSWISVLDLEGVGGDVNLLARAVAVPRLDPEGHRGARVLSPLTALLVVADPEGKYATQQSRQRVLNGMIRSVLNSLPPQLRTDAMWKDLKHLLHVRAWPEEFEFAHFSNSELARAIRAEARADSPPEAQMRRQLQTCRAAGDTIKNIWKNWRRPPSKVAIAEHLWPTLEKRILNPRSRKAIPIVEVLEEAIGISHEVRQAREMAVRD